MTFFSFAAGGIFGVVITFIIIAQLENWANVDEIGIRRKDDEDRN